MTHKVHPKIFRIKETSDWYSRWLTKKDFPKFLEEDFKIKEFLKKKLVIAGLEKIEIERSPGKINIIITCARPGLIIGRGGGGIDDLKKDLEKIIYKEKPSFTSVYAKAKAYKKTSEGKQELKLEIKEVKDPWIHSALVSQWIAQQLEKRIRRRRVLRQALDRITSHKEVEGARVEVSGRLDGAEIARREWLKKGRLPRQTLRAIIDYGTAEAHCSYGVIGVKVWIYKGEKFE